MQQSATEGVSLTNLSHDSGLTTSDSQLYAFEEGNNSFSSSDDLRDQRKMSAASRYSGGNGNYGDFTLPGQVPQTPSSNPSSKRSNHKTNHRDKIYRRLQKKEVTDNTLFNKYSGVVGGGHHPNVPGGGSDSAFVIDTTQLLLRRTASEESLAVNQMKDDSSPISAVSAHSARLARRRPAAHRKGRAPAPPHSSGLNSVGRSNSVNHTRIGDGKRSADWYRSRSTTRLNNDTTSSSCSTLSDEDSTPHVSRSNSYGRSENDNTNGSFNNNVQTPPPTHDGSYDIYLRDDHLSTKPNTTTTPTPNMQLVFNDTPPGYEETISRQRLLKHYNRSNSFVISSSTPTTTSSANVKTKLVFEDGPPPLPPKTERPPLPPKQRIRLTSAAGSSADETYVNADELRCFEAAMSSGEEQQHLVYPAYTAAGARIHVSDVTMRSSPSLPVAPRLPPKEPSPPKKKQLQQRGISKTRISATTQTRTTSNAETQTDETDFYLMYQDEEGVWHREGDEDNEDSDDEEDEEIMLHDVNSSSAGSQIIIVDQADRPMSDEYFRLQTASAYSQPEYHMMHMGESRILPVLQHDSSSMVKMASTASGSRRKLEPTHSVPNMSSAASLAATGVPKLSGGRHHIDPVIKGEINWSVSQLRSLFNQQGQGVEGGQHSPNGGSSSSTSSSTNGGNQMVSYHHLQQQHPQQHLQQQQPFTNGEYIESNKAAVSSRHILIDSRRHPPPKQPQPSVVHTYQRVYGGAPLQQQQNGPLPPDLPLPLQPLADTDSDQESYV